VARAQLGLSTVLAPFTISSRDHEVDTVILSVANFDRGERDWSSVGQGLSSRHARVETAPALDEHQIRTAGVGRQEVARDRVVLTARRTADGNRIAVRQVSIGERLLDFGSGGFTGVDQQGAAALLANLAQVIRKEVDGSIVPKCAHAGYDGAEGRQGGRGGGRYRDGLAARQQIVEAGVERVAAEQTVRSSAFAHHAEPLLSAEHVETRLESKGDILGGQTFGRAGSENLLAVFGEREQGRRGIAGHFVCEVAGGGGA
jgi:hypothetical protein